MQRETILERNLEELAQRDPELAGKVREAEETGTYTLHRTGEQHFNVITETDTGRIAFYGTDDPIRTAESYLEGMKIRFAPFVVFMGLGLGYHLDHCLEHLSEEWGTKEIIIYEKDIELFRLALSIGDYRNILKHPHVHFFVGGDPEESFVRLRTDIFNQDLYDLRSIKIIPLPASIALDPAYYRRATDTVKKAACQVMIMVGNDAFDSLLGFENMFENMHYIFSNPGINELTGQFEGKPGILVAAGPSLNKNMHFLKGLRNKALIMACDTSLIPLVKKGIRPHFVCSLERTPGTELYYSGIDDFKDISLVAPAVLMPETIEAFKGKKYVAYRQYPYFDWLEDEKGSIVCGLSVANLAFKLLAYLGCDPIILIGQDLSYAQDGDTHVEGNIFGTRDEGLLAKPMIELEGNDGGVVKSEKAWELTKLHYEEDIARYHGTCINATEGGARIRGAERMTFREAIDTYCQNPFYPQAVIDATHERFQRNLNMKERFKRVYDKSLDTGAIIDQTIEDFESALDEARLVEKEIIRPFMKETKECDDADMERLLSVEKKWLNLSIALISDTNLYQITCQILQSYDVWLACELSFLKDIYTNKKILSMARVRKMTEWFAVVGSFLIFMRKVLKNGERMISQEMEQC